MDGSNSTLKGGQGAPRPLAVPGSGALAPGAPPFVRLNIGSAGMALGAAACCLALCGLQLAMGGEQLPSAMFVGATFFGLLAVLEAGIVTALGVLNALLVGRFLLGAFLMKNVVEGEPITANLLEPEDTASVMLLGFAGVYLATVVVRRLVRRVRVLEITNTRNGLLALTIVLVVGGTISIVALRIASSGDEVVAGGVWGLAKEFVSFRTAAVPALMLYLWRNGSRRWLTHPAVLVLTAFIFAQGVLGSSKQAMAEPIALYVMMAIARYGWRHPVAWLGVPMAIVVFQFFIQPIGQYARNQGGRDRSVREAAMATADIILGYLTDPAYRNRIMHAEESAAEFERGKARYLEAKHIAFGRVAMIGEADRLVSATDRFGETGFETIENSLLYVVPYFLYPNKSQSASGNYLGRYAGDAADDDLSTQFSYGFMANAYNAYGMAWVLPICFLTSGFVLGLVGLCASGRFYSDPWSILAIAAVHQSYVEASFSGQITVIHLPIDAGILLGLTTALVWLARRRTAGPTPARTAR